MSRDDIREALLLLEEPVEASPRFREELLRRFMEEATAEGVPEAPETRPPSPRLRRLRWLRPRLVPALAIVAVIALLGTFFVLVPRPRSAFAVLEQARDRFTKTPFHATLRNVFGEFVGDDTLVIEIWFKSETQWRATVKSSSNPVSPEEPGDFTVFDGKLFGRYQSAVDTIFIQPASEIDDPYQYSGVGIHDPTVGQWPSATGLKPTARFLNENCRVDESEIAGRSADKLTCDTGSESDINQGAEMWLDRETGLILKMATSEAVREFMAIEFEPEFPSGIFDVAAPEGAKVRWAGSGPAPAEYQGIPGKEVAATFSVPVPPAGGWGVEVAFGFGSLWMLTGERYRQGELHRMDPRTGKVVATIPIDGDFGDFTVEPTGPPPQPSQEELERMRRGEAPPPDETPSFRVQGLALGEGFVWVGKIAGGRGESHVAVLERIDPQTNKVVGSPIRTGDGIGDVTVAAGAVWVTDARTREMWEGDTQFSYGSLAKVHAKTLEVTHIELEGGTLSSLGAGNGPVLGDGSLWVPILVRNPKDPRDDRFLVRLDPATNAVQAKTSRDIGLGLSELVFAEDALWFLGGDLRSTWVRRLDPRTNRVVATVAERPRADSPRFNALVGGGGYLWVSDAIDNTVLKIDPKTNQLVGSIGVGRWPGQIAVGGGSIWVLNVEDRTVSRIDFE